MAFILASNLSTRVEELIEQQFSLDALAALVRGYSVTLDSLLAAPAGDSAGRPPSPTLENGGKAMAVTKAVPREWLEAYFDEFTKRFLLDDSPEAVDVEVLEPDWGEQVLAHGARLLGITYDRRKHSLEFALEGGDHRIIEPAEVWTVEEEDGFISAVEVVHSDGGREVVSVKRFGLQRQD